MKTVLTSGSFDLIHIGHALYLEEAAKYGDYLVVGVDSDAKVAARKGPDRPVVPQDERLAMVQHLRHVDEARLKYLAEPKWSLIMELLPEVLVATEGTYTPDEVRMLGHYVGQVVILSRMAETSTSARIRDLTIKNHGW